MIATKIKLIACRLLLWFALSSAEESECDGYSLGTMCVEACPAPGAVLEDLMTCHCSPDKCKQKNSIRDFLVKSSNFTNLI